jgi:hypothetical protein
MFSATLPKTHAAQSLIQHQCVGVDGLNAPGWLQRQVVTSSLTEHYHMQLPAACQSFNPPDTNGCVKLSSLLSPPTL